MNNEDNKIKIEYEDRFVAFLDILGFKDFVYKDDKEKIYLYLDSVHYAINYLQEMSEKQIVGIEYIVISDSIIITLKKEKNLEENINRLRHLCISIGFLQFLLASENLWLKGAISSGEAYFHHENRQIIGKAYIEAYLLQEKLISNPQVILDNKIVKELQFKNSTDLINKINDKENGYLKFKNCGRTILYEWKRTSYIEKDFPLFIDYMSLIINLSENTMLNESPDTIYNIINEVVGYLEDNIYLDTNLYSKYKWVVNYMLSNMSSNSDKKFSKFEKRLKNL